MKRTLSIIMALVLTFTALTCLAGCGSSGSSSNGSNASGGDATGDSPSGNKGEVNVYSWGEYIALGQEEDLMNVIEAFEDETGIKVNYTTYDTNEELYSKLTQSNVSYDVIVPSDYMISKMIKDDLLLELNYDNIPNYKYIDDRFKKLACDPDGMPDYMWWLTLIVFLIAGFIQAYVWLTLLGPVYLMRGSIAQQEKERENILTKQTEKEYEQNLIYRP